MRRRSLRSRLAAMKCTSCTTMASAAARPRSACRLWMGPEDALRSSGWRKKIARHLLQPRAHLCAALPRPVRCELLEPYSSRAKHLVQYLASFGGDIELATR